jgi:hypothetical protein
LRKIKIFPKVQPLPRRSATVKEYKLPLPHRYRAAMDISAMKYILQFILGIEYILF